MAIVGSLVPEPPRWFQNVLIQPFVPNCAVAAFDAGILLGLSGPDVDAHYRSYQLAVDCSVKGSWNVTCQGYCRAMSRKGLRHDPAEGLY